MGGGEKISSEHRARLACIYVRQSTPAQTRNNTESLEQQYELSERAVALGWPAERIRVIDTDLGISGDSIAAADREGFKELVAEVALTRVGLILGTWVSRLARDNSAWYQLLDLCSLTGTLIADSDGIYDPADYSDRLLLGLKGTISEAELHLIKGRLIAGLRHKAAKGELRISLPAGYDYAPNGAIVMSADEAVREAVHTVFARFLELCSARQVTLSLRDDGLLLPRRRGQGRVEWVQAAYSAVHDMLTNPTYAGAYAFGRRQSHRQVGEDGRACVSSVAMPRERWQTLIFDHHPAYISWDQHEQILAQIARNAAAKGRAGAAREGRALLQGLLRCGRCGRRMHSAYSGARSRDGWARRYHCDPHEGGVEHNNSTDSPECQGLGGRQLDEAVLAEVFRVLEPAAIAATAKALADQEASEAARLRVFETAVERARYEAERARRQFDACEPENRLVARTLEGNWEKALREVERAETELAAQRARRTSPLATEELERLQRAGADLRAIFDAPTTSQRDRKLLLRTLISEICVTVDRETRRIDVQITWDGGAKTNLEPLVLRRMGQTYARSTPEETVALVRHLAAHYDDETIAGVLARQHQRTGTGLRFNKRRVTELRKAHGIPAFTPTRHADDDGELVTVGQAARELDVTPQTLWRWLRDGFISGEHPAPRAPWRIRLNAELRAKVAEDAPDGWLSLDEAARALGVVRQTVLHRVQRGELTAVHVRRGKRKGLRIQVKPEHAGLFDTA